jgi:hypothetical protein
MEIVDGAPAQWNTVINIQSYNSVIAFQGAIKYHKETLIAIPDIFQFKQEWDCLNG